MIALDCQPYSVVYGNENSKDHGRLGDQHQPGTLCGDNGSNFIKVMNEAGLPSYGCFAHSLQLVVHDGLLTQRVVIDLLAVCRSIVGHFKHSSVASHKLARIQDNLGLPQHTLKQDVATPMELYSVHVAVCS